MRSYSSVLAEVFSSGVNTILNVHLKYLYHCLPSIGDKRCWLNGNLLQEKGNFSYFPGCVKTACEVVNFVNDGKNNITYFVRTTKISRLSKYQLLQLILTFTFCSLFDIVSCFLLLMI